MKLLSIIIPVYNSENKIDFLLESLIQLKKYKSLIEIIFINDGSNDNSEQIIQKFKKENNLQITLYSQKK